MEQDETPHTITDPDGKSEPRRVVHEKALHFSVLMAIRDCVAYSGTPKRGRDDHKRMIADSVVRHFQMSGYRVYSGLGLQAGRQRETFAEEGRGTLADIVGSRIRWGLDG
jgi:hypothetical protein